jgi:histidinol-phosphate aminotransferase
MTDTPFRQSLLDTSVYRSTWIEVKGDRAKLNHNECAWDARGRYKDVVLARMRAADWRRYPDPHATEFRKALSLQVGHPAEGLLIANGGNELVLRVFCALHEDSDLIVCPPAYYIYERLAQVLGISLHEVDLAPSNQATGTTGGLFDLDIDAVLKKAASLERPVICLANPNNPTGNLMAPEKVERLLAEFPGLIILDEAYTDYSGNSLLSRSRNQKNLIVLRTFSKAFAMAGVRLGYLAGHVETVLELEKVFQPYAVGLFTQVAGTVALKFQDVMRQRVDETRAQRERLRSEISSISGVEVFPSATNFVLVRFKDRHAQVLEAFRDEDVIVRDVDHVTGLERCIRITVGTPDENSRVIRCVVQACS